jgi:hypothetical protein
VARKAAVAQLVEQRGLSQVRACRLVGLNRSSMNYRPRRPDDSLLRQRLRELAAERRRFGYRRLGWLLEREGHVMNRKKLYRLYREEKLMVRRRRGRKRALGTRAPMTLPGAINQRWSLDFVADALSDGRRFRILCVVDDFSRECLATVVDTSLGGVRVVRELDRLTAERALILPPPRQDRLAWPAFARVTSRWAIKMNSSRMKTSFKGLRRIQRLPRRRAFCQNQQFATDTPAALSGSSSRAESDRRSVFCRPNNSRLRRLGQRGRVCRRDRISFFGAVECPLFNTGFEFLRNGDAMHNFATRLFFGPRQNNVSKLKNVFGRVDHYVLHR